jgi:hypothetical protein
MGTSDKAGGSVPYDIIVVDADVQRAGLAEDIIGVRHLDAEECAGLSQAFACAARTGEGALFLLRRVR